MMIGSEVENNRGSGNREAPRRGIEEDKRRHNSGCIDLRAPGPGPDRDKKGLKKQRTEAARSREAGRVGKTGRTK